MTRAIRIQKIELYRSPWLQLAVVGLTAWAVPIAWAQSNQRAPLPPPLPYRFPQESPDISRPEVRFEDEPVFEISDLGPGNRPDAAADSGTRSGTPAPVNSPNANDQTFLDPAERRPDQQHAPTPVLGPISEYMRQQEEEEIRQLRSLKTNIGQLNQIINSHKRREDEARDSAAQAQRREKAALQTARAAELLQLEVAAEKEELRRLTRELERREQNLRKQQQQRELAQRRGAASTAPATESNAPLSESAPQQPTTAGISTDSSSGDHTPPEAAPSATPITAGAVDHRALADNLFGAAEYKLAANIYQQLLGQQPEPRDVMWYRFQTANCFRHLGNQDLAASYYRDVVADPLDPFLAETAKWWLNKIELRSGIQQRTTELALMVDQASNVIDEKLK